MSNATTIEDLQSVSQQVSTDAERIQKLEDEKRSVDPGGARFRQLSDEIERLSAEMQVTSHAESQLADELAGQPDLPTIEEADRQSS